jgi:LacI family transcriptional regulator
MDSLKLIPSIQGHAKYKQAKESIYQHILSSGARPGDKIGTEAVLMKELGISVTTVRRALDELVREGILVRRVGKGTFFKSNPAERDSTASSTVLLLGQNSWQFLREDVYYGRIIGALGTILREADLRQVVLINNWGQNPEAELEDIRRHNPAAIVSVYTSIEDRPFLLSVATLGVPMIIYGHLLEGLPARQVYFDDYQGGVEMANYLLEKGHREFGVMGLPQISPAGGARFSGFVDTVKKRKARILRQMHATGFGELDGHAGMGQILQAGKLPTALFCAGDLLAYGAIKKLEESGRSVPGDIAVAGYSDFQVSAFYHPRLTTIHVDLELMGREIGNWVVDVANGPAADRFASIHKKLPVKLVVRETA